jgi:hypothetical protein
MVKIIIESPIWAQIHNNAERVDPLLTLTRADENLEVNKIEAHRHAD